jgi:hypothetical protein
MKPSPARALLRLVTPRIPRPTPSGRPDRPIVLFCYHKTGTVLLERVFTEISERYGWRFKTFFGHQTILPAGVDVALMAHSLVANTFFAQRFVGVHVIRDPRDIVVSGYFYHLRTQEKWCINNDFTQRRVIRYPQVPYSQEHRSEAWKRDYLASLGGRSYQDNLRHRSARDGLHFEMRHYGAWTIEAMRDWNYSNPQVLELRFEDIMANYDQAFGAIFQHLFFSEKQISDCIEIAQKHDIARKTADEIGRNSHVTSLDTSRWKAFLEDEHIAAFPRLFGEVLQLLGYSSDPAS